MNNGPSAGKDEAKQLQEFEVKFTNKARPRYPPVKSTAFHGSKQLESPADGQIQSEKKNEKINRQNMLKNTSTLLEQVGFKMQRINSKLLEKSRPKSVKYSLERQACEASTLFSNDANIYNLPHYNHNSNGKFEKVRDKSVPKLTITFNDRKVSVETSRGRESSQKQFLRNIENEITRYNIKKSRQNSNSTICISNDVRSLDKCLARPLSSRPLDKFMETKSLRNRSPDQLSVRSKSSMHSRKFDPKNLLRLFGTPKEPSNAI